MSAVIEESVEIHLPSGHVALVDAGCAEQQRLTPTDPMGTGNLLEEL